MGQIISIIGNKGGTGKTTLSHMLAHGLGLFGCHAVSVLTDTYRDKLSKLHRGYLPFDARAPENLDKAAAKLAAADNWIGVLDGGGNRPEMDQKLAEMADLVLLPFRDSHEDIRVVARDLERFPNAYALPSQWPTNRFAEAAAQRAVGGLLADFQHRILAPVYALSASKLFLQNDAPAAFPAQLNNACREIAIQAMELLGMEIRDTAWLAGQDPQKLAAGMPGAVICAAGDTRSHPPLSLLKRR
jgi:hypothetical protein